MKQLLPYFIVPAYVLTMATAKETWSVDTAEQWSQQQAEQVGIELKDGFAYPSEGKKATYKSKVKKLSKKQKLSSLVVEQSAIWQNWKKVPNVGPKNAQDAPVMLSVGDGDYWMFARYGGGNIDRKVYDRLKIEEKVYMGKMTQAEADKAVEKINAKPDSTEKGGNFVSKDPNQTNATGGEKLGLGGYHAWHSKDLKKWTHHGPVSNYKSRWMTTAEYVDGKFYLYYDNPNDQDPHLIVDSDLKDGKMGKDHGLVFADPSNGSDNAVIRGLDGKFHFIYEDWTPLNASKQAWDSPLAGHAISDDGINDWKILPPAIDHRTIPTGKTLTYPHPHQNPRMLKYQEHMPKQHAYGDWAAITIGERYYLFADYDPSSNKKRGKGMSCAWFTSDSLDEKFTFCDNIGEGHPDPDIMFAEGQFYLITQFSQDFVSPGPWVAGVEARAGVDTDNDGTIDQWTEWQTLEESYAHKPGFSKQVKKTPAQLDISKLPAGHGFQFELKLADTTENDSKPILDKVTLSFE